MPKKKILIVIHQLNIGGVQESLFPVLDVFDYGKVDVTLYIRKNRIDLLPYVNPKVSKIVINEDTNNYYRKPIVAIIELLSRFFNTIHLCKTYNHMQAWIRNKIIFYQHKYEYKHYFCHDQGYDVAISLIQGVTAMFVCDYIKANKKVMFFRDSTDSEHEIHEAIMPEFDTICCVSDGAKKALSKFYPKFAYKMTVIETFVSTNLIIKKSNEYELKKEKLTFVTCGRITNVKGYDLAVNAAVILKKLGVTFIWYFVGDGIFRGKIESLIKENEMEQYIVITGLKTNPFPYIKLCDIYVQPSYEESFGRTINEAIILKKPVVATKTIGASDQIVDKKNGVLTDISAEGIAKGIETLLNDQDLLSRIIDDISINDYSQDFENYKQKWDALIS